MKPAVFPLAATSSVFSSTLCVCQCQPTSAVGLPHPLAAVGAHDAHELLPNQLMFVGALQGDDRAHTGTISLDNLLGTQGWEGHGFALSPGLTCEARDC